MFCFHWKVCFIERLRIMILNEASLGEEADGLLCSFNFFYTNRALFHTGNKDIKKKAEELSQFHISDFVKYAQNQII